MGTGYSLRHLHETRVDQRLESIEKAVSITIGPIITSILWLELLCTL